MKPKPRFVKFRAYNDLKIVRLNLINLINYYVNKIKDKSLII